MNIPGMVVIHGALRSKGRPPFRIVPQLGGVVTPRPRKLKPDSVRIAPPMRSDALTMMGAMVFKRMCLKTMREFVAPMALAAST